MRILTDQAGGENAGPRLAGTGVRLKVTPRSHLTERIFYRERAEAAPVLEIFRYQAFSADLEGCLDDQRVPEGEGVLFFSSSTTATAPSTSSCGATRSTAAQAAPVSSHAGVQPRRAFVQGRH
jgi:hypothetical protein